MGKVLKKIDINLLSSYWRTQNRLVRKHWTINCIIFCGLLVLSLFYFYHWQLKPQARDLQFSQKQVAILQKQISEFSNSPNMDAIAIPEKSEMGTVTIQQQNADFRDILQQIALNGDMSLVLSENIQGTITLFFNSLPWRDALDVVLELGGLMVEERENVLVIRTEDEVVESAKRELILNP